MRPRHQSKQHRTGQIRLLRRLRALGHQLVGETLPILRDEDLAAKSMADTACRMQVIEARVSAGDLQLGQPKCRPLGVRDYKCTRVAGAVLRAVRASVSSEGPDLGKHRRLYNAFVGAQSVSAGCELQSDGKTLAPAAQDQARPWTPASCLAHRTLTTRGRALVKLLGVEHCYLRAGPVRQQKVQTRDSRIDANPCQWGPGVSSRPWALEMLRIWLARWPGKLNK